MSDYKDYLKTLRRVPDEIILSVATRNLKLAEGASCLCGWAVREAIARIRQTDPVHVFFESGNGDRCATLFGGTEDEWQAIYHGVADDPQCYDWTTGRYVPNEGCRLPEIERAFVERVLECVP